MRLRRQVLEDCKVACRERNFGGGLAVGGRVDVAAGVGKRAHDGAVTDERIVEDICRWPAALKAIIEAKGAKVEWLDNRKGRRQSKPYQPPRIEQEQAAFDRALDVMMDLYASAIGTTCVLLPKPQRS